MSAPAIRESIPPLPEPSADPRIPLLGTFATLLAVLTYILRQWVLRLGSESPLARETLLQANELASFLRDASALAGLVALGTAIWTLVLPSSRIGGWTRMGLAGLAGIFMPTLALATLVPARRVGLLIVLISAGTGNLIAVGLASSLAVRRAPKERRLAIGFGAATAFLSFLSTSVGIMGQLTVWEQAYRVQHFLQVAGLLCFLGTVFALIACSWPKVRAQAGIALGLGLVIAGVLFAGEKVAENITGERYSSLFYAATHIDLATTVLPRSLYEASLALFLGFGISFGALGTRVFGLALCLWMIAGFSPSTPYTNLWMVLSLVMVSLSFLSSEESENRSDSRREQTAADLDSTRAEIEAALGLDDSHAE